MLFLWVGSIAVGISSRHEHFLKHSGHINSALSRSFNGNTVLAAFEWGMIGVFVFSLQR
ncbi:hypothetical protein M9458_045705, partial [Cirrhinus mrigala]